MALQRTKQRGRPTKYVLPPRIDATAEQLAASVLRAKPKEFNEAETPRDALNNPADDGLFCYGALLQVFSHRL